MRYQENIQYCMLNNATTTNQADRLSTGDYCTICFLRAAPVGRGGYNTLDKSKGNLCPYAENSPQLQIIYENAQSAKA